MLTEDELQVELNGSIKDVSFACSSITCHRPSQETKWQEYLVHAVFQLTLRSSSSTPAPTPTPTTTSESKSSSAAPDIIYVACCLPSGYTMARLLRDASTSSSSSSSAAPSSPPSIIDTLTFATTEPVQFAPSLHHALLSCTNGAYRTLFDDELQRKMDALASAMNNATTADRDDDHDHDAYDSDEGSEPPSDEEAAL